MIRSMTTFARRERVEDGWSVKMELRSTNFRYIDVRVRLPRWMSPVEERIRQYVAETLQRGKVDLFIDFEGEGMAAPLFKADLVAVRAYLEAVEAVKEATGLAGELRLSDLLMLFRDAIVQDQEGVDTEVIWGFISPELGLLLEEASTQAEREGTSLEKDLSLRLSRVEEFLSLIERQKAEVFPLQKEALKKRILSLAADAGVPEERILQEWAVMASRLDITEEIVRAKSHVERFRELLKEEVPVGRRLDFLLQELFREVNTIASKAQDSRISQIVVEMKGEVEKIREQVQNVV